VKRQRIVLSDAAVSDIVEQADWYENQADHRLAERWEKAVTATFLRISKAPRSGPLCRFKADELLDVRRMLVAGFPRHLISIDFGTKNCSFFASSMALVIWKGFFESKENCD
jgi:plasmid stabilization system protein ParE